MLFLVLKTKLYAPAVTLLAKGYQLSKRLRRGLEKSVYWNEYNGMNKNRTNEYRYFLELNFVVINRLFVLVSTNQDVNAKRSQTRRYYLQKGIIENNYNIIVNGNNFYDEPIWYKKTRRE